MERVASQSLQLGGLDNMPSSRKSPKRFTHAKLIGLPVKGSPAAGFVDGLHLDTCAKRTDLLLDYHELQNDFPPILFERDGRPWERIKGNYVPVRLRFVDGHFVEGEALLTCLEGLPQKDPGRLLNDFWAWRFIDGRNYYLFDLRREENDTLLIKAATCLLEPHQDQAWEANFERKWCPAPLPPVRLIPVPKQIYRRYGGDPVSVWLDGRMHHSRLFIGGLDTQSEQRPDVSAVLNLGEDPSRWVVNESPFQADRWARKGEGSKGMTVPELAEEANWVIAHLKAGERVLVHCSAGMNRSSTICCAVLIRLEGLSAEAALERVREHHPWARPDPSHWLRLRWLAALPGS
jgi:hypothetical protein